MGWLKCRKEKYDGFHRKAYNKERTCKGPVLNFKHRPDNYNSCTPSVQLRHKQFPFFATHNSFRLKGLNYYFDLYFLIINYWNCLPYLLVYALNTSSHNENQYNILLYPGIHKYGYWFAGNNPH